MTVPLVEDVAELRQWVKGGRNPREISAMRPDCWEQVKTKLKRRVAVRQTNHVRTTEVLARIEAAANETPRQTLSVLHRRGSLSRCFKRGRAELLP